jgi:hypothetical protein
MVPSLIGVTAGVAQVRALHEEAVSLLPPSGGPTQVGTTPELSFRAKLRGQEEVTALEVAAL